MSSKPTYDILELAAKWQSGTITEEEKAFYESWYASFNDVELELDQQESAYAKLSDKIYVAVQNRIAADGTAHSAAVDKRKAVVQLWSRIAIAAAVAAITLGVWLYYTADKSGAGQAAGAVQYTQDVAPGKNGATITLGSGEEIQLSGAKGGIVIGKGLKYNDSTAVISDRHPELNPELSSASGSRTIQTLTASTTRGQTYQFTLPDGTRVWLNADSKISFPSRFEEIERKVILEGEGYFEVYHDPKKPFSVATKRQNVVVLGTHFNISAYADDEGETTTLLEGSVRVEGKGLANRGENLLLKPDQQSILHAGGSELRKVDAQKAAAWKNGDFIFDNESLENIMKQVGRWYDVDVQYEDDQLKQMRLGGFISRNKQLSAVLKMFPLTQKLTFKIEGKKITVLPSP